MGAKGVDMRIGGDLGEERVEGCLNILCDIGGFGDIECEVLEPGHAVLGFDTASAMRNPYGDLHGGFYMTVCDMAACMAVYTNGSKPVTLQCSFNFCEGIHVNGQRVTVDARVVRKGKTIQVVNVEFVDEAGTVCLRSSFTTFAKKELAGEEPFPTQEESLETVRAFFAEAGREMR